MGILTFKDRFPNVSHAEFVRGHIMMGGLTIQNSVADISVEAQINAFPFPQGWKGRWIAVCPTCNGAEYVNTDTLLFMCCSCGNWEFGGQWLRVKVPTPMAKGIIETLLMKRPGRFQNWLPGETASELYKQNLALGVK